MTWSPEDTEALKAMIKDGLGYEDMAVKLGKPYRAVQNKAWRIKNNYINPNVNMPATALTSADSAFNKALKATIEEYWKKRGYEVRVEIEEGEFSLHHRFTVHGLRSDMVNGLPVRRAVRRAA
jgi:hypothetical protein